MDSLNDLQLIDSSLAGVPGAFDVLVGRYQDRLIHSLEYTLGSRDDAMDFAQQAFLLAWKNLHSFRRESGFYSWLYRIARNVAITGSRRHRVQTGSLDLLNEDAGFEPADQSDDAAPEHSLQNDEQARTVRETLQQIPAEFRQPLVMKEMDGLSYEQIADVLEIPVGTVRSRIFRARMELAERLRRIMSDD